MEPPWAGLTLGLGQRLLLYFRGRGGAGAAAALHLRVTGKGMALRWKGESTSYIISVGL